MFIIPSALIFAPVAAEGKRPQSSMILLSSCLTVGVVFLSSGVVIFFSQLDTRPLVLWSNIFNCINAMFLKRLFSQWGSTHPVPCRYLHCPHFNIYQWDYFKPLLTHSENHIQKIHVGRICTEKITISSQVSDRLLLWWSETVSRKTWTMKHERGMSERKGHSSGHMSMGVQRKGKKIKSADVERK